MMLMFCPVVVAFCSIVVAICPVDVAICPVDVVICDFQNSSAQCDSNRSIDTLLFYRKCRLPIASMA